MILHGKPKLLYLLTLIIQMKSMTVFGQPGYAINSGLPDNHSPNPYEKAPNKGSFKSGLSKNSGMLFPGFNMMNIDSILGNRESPLANEPYTDLIDSPFASITKTKLDEDIDSGGNSNERVVNKIQLIEWKDKSNIERNRKKILDFLDRMPNQRVPLHLLEKQLEKLRIIHAIQRNGYPQEKALAVSDKKLKRIKNGLRTVKDLFLDLFR